jgi:hypothetical protein
MFAECQTLGKEGARQRAVSGRPKADGRQSLPRADGWHSAKRLLCRVSSLDTRQSTFLFFFCFCPQTFCGMFLHYCRRFETGGSLSRRVSVLRAPAQMGRARGRARRGERSEEAGVRRERGGNPAAFVFVPRPGRVRLQ